MKSLTHRLLSLVGRWPFISVITVAAGLLVVGLAVQRGTAESGVSFGDVEVGANQAGQEGMGQTVGKFAEAQDIQVAVMGLLADETQTTVALRIQGESGSQLVTGGGVVLVDPTGTEHRVIGASSDLQDPSMRTVVFEPVAAVSGAMTVLVTELYAEDESMAALRRIEGPWKVEFDFDGNVLPAEVTALEEASHRRPFGKGSVVLESVVQAPSGTIFRGRIEGYDFEEIPAFQLRAIIRVEAEALTPISLQGGFGENRERFEFRFAPTSGNVSLTLTPWIRPDLDRDLQQNSTLVEALAEAQAEWALDIGDPQFK